MWMMFNYADRVDASPLWGGYSLQVSIHKLMQHLYQALHIFQVLSHRRLSRMYRLAEISAAAPGQS
jgi:hypothetical protein